MLLLLLLLLAGVVSSTPSCPVFFFIIPYDLYQVIPVNELTQADYGNYFLRNGTQYPPPYFIANELLETIMDTSPCSITISAICDACSDMERDIRTWVEAECNRLGKDPKTECFRP